MTQTDKGSGKITGKQQGSGDYPPVFLKRAIS